MSDWSSRKSGGKKSTKDVVVAARIARQKRQIAILQVASARKIQALARAVGPRRNLGQQLLELTQRRCVDIGRVCNMQLALGVAFIPPLPLMLDLAFKLVVACRHLKEKNSGDELLCDILGYMEQAMRSSDSAKGLRSLFPTSLTIPSPSLAKFIVVTRIVIGLGSAKTARTAGGNRTRARALSFLAALTRASSSCQGTEADRDLRRHVLCISSLNSPHHSMAAVVLASLSDKHDDIAIALELLAGKLMCENDEFCNEVWWGRVDVGVGVACRVRDARATDN
jgi:hypothetical protein